MALLGSSTSHHYWFRMHFGATFQNFAIDFVTIYEKRFPSSLLNIAPSGRPSPPGMRHVLALFPHDLVLLQSPILHCMLYFAHLLQCAEAKIEGRRCCPPQRAFNNISKFMPAHRLPLGQQQLSPRQLRQWLELLLQFWPL